jgi:hypothetical protein
MKGTSVHGELETYLKHGTKPDVLKTVQILGQEFLPGKVAASMLPLLPDPPLPYIEHPWEIRTDHVWYGGIIDLFMPPGEYLYQATRKVLLSPRVSDHKTTSDLRYAKTPETLATDPQAILYGKWALDNHDVNGTGIVELNWNYVQVKGSHRTKPVHTQLTKSHVEEQMRRIDSVAVQMHLAQTQGKKALDLLPNPSACDKYGGCPHRNVRCTLTPHERMVSIMSQHSLKDKLTAGAPLPPAPPTLDALELAKQDGWAVHPVDAAWYYRGQECVKPEDLRVRYAPPAPPAPPAVPAPPAPPAVPSLPDPINAPESILPPVDKMMVNGREIPIQPAPPLAGPAGDGEEDDVDDMFTPMNRDALKRYAMDHKIQHPPKAREATIRDIIRAELQRRGIPYDGAPVPSLEDVQAEVQKTVELAAAAGAKMPIEAVQLPPSAPVQTPDPRLLAAATNIVQAPSPVEKALAAQVAATPAPAVGPGGFILYVNCLPLKGEQPLPLLSVVGDVLRDLAQAENKMHYRELAFGKGPGLAALAVQTAGITAPAIFVDANSTEGRDLLPTLQAMASMVIMGLSA